VKQKEQYTEEWELYEKGKEYNYSLDLYNKVASNERFYRGDQWEGINSNGLPKPTFNIFKRIINYYTSNLLSSSVSMRFSYASPFGSGNAISADEAAAYAELLNGICRTRWEKLKMDSLLLDALTDGAISGDAIAYTYWDKSVRTGQPYSGDFRTVLVDNTNVFFGDPNMRDPQKQPYILISMRENVSELQKAARKAGLSEDVVRKIVPDSDNTTQSGDMAKKEIESTKCISLIRLWKDENGHVLFRKSVRSAVLTDTTDTGLTLYPICVFNWTKVKNSWHGEAVATGLIENQIFLNKGFAMVMKHMMDTAFSKVIYDGTLIDEWSNKVGEAIRVDGPVGDVVRIISPGAMQSGMLDVLQLALTNTKECLGATDAALGDVKPTNTSAILALQQAATLPLENIKRQFYQFVEDIGTVWLDFIFAYYSDDRLVYIPEGDGGRYAALKLGKARNALFDCRIDVGAVNYWSEISCLSTLDNLLTNGYISTLQYLERVPDNLIPKKKALMEEIRLQQEQKGQTNDTEADI
jgi:hypothetical protein